MHYLGLCSNTVPVCPSSMSLASLPLPTDGNWRACTIFPLHTALSIPSEWELVERNLSNTLEKQFSGVATGRKQENKDYVLMYCSSSNIYTESNPGMVFYMHNQFVFKYTVDSICFNRWSSWKVYVWGA